MTVVPPGHDPGGGEVVGDVLGAAEVLLVGCAEHHDLVGELVGADPAHLGDARPAVDQHQVVALGGQLLAEPLEEKLAFPVEVEVLPVEGAHGGGVRIEIGAFAPARPA